MAISRDKKEALVKEFDAVLGSSKMTVAAVYIGTSVADMQKLRRAAREAGVGIKVIKNRLVKAAMKQSKVFENTDVSLLNGQLLYAYSTEDEVAPAQVIDKLSKDIPSLALVAGFDNSGSALDTMSVKALASLPSKQQLIAETIAQLLSPIHDTTNALSGNLHALLDGVTAKATN